MANDDSPNPDEHVHQVEQPIGSALTRHHFILLDPTGVRIIRALDDQVVYEETIELVSI